MRDVKSLPFFIAIEGLITIFLVIEGNYIGATGWGFLMLTNIDILIKNKKNGNTNNPK